MIKSLNKRSTRRGFTLIEIAVSLTVFMIFIGIIMSSFIHLVGVQIAANRYRKVYKELDEVFTLIATDVREYGVDFDCFETAVCDPNIHDYQVLAFISKDGLERHIIEAEPTKEGEEERVVYKLNYAVQSRVTRKSEWPAVVYRSLETKNTEFVRFDFTLSPLADPYDIKTTVGSGNLFQPSITINAEARARAYKDKPGIVMQTTISSRLYNVRTF